MRTWDPDRGVPFSNFAWLCATREARNALRAARANKHHLLTTATPLDLADGTRQDACTAGDTARRPRGRAPRRQRVSARPPRACSERRRPRPGRQDRSPANSSATLIARARTLSPLERRALALASNDHPPPRDRRHPPHPRPRRQQRAPARPPQAPRTGRRLMAAGRRDNRTRRVDARVPARERCRLRVGWWAPVRLEGAS